MRSPQALSGAQQLYFLRRNPAAVGTGDSRRGVLVWVMEVTPTPSSRTYTVRIELATGTPEVTVLVPDLRALAGGRRLPHVYSEAPVRLCLYHPRRGEWASTMRLDQTVVPWIYLWLYYFERWLATDDWAGGGEHPPVPTGRPRSSPRVRVPERTFLRSERFGACASHPRHNRSGNVSGSEKTTHG